MILFTDSLFLTNEKEGFRVCRETRTTSSKTMTVLLCEAGYIDVYYHGEMLRINKNEMFVRIPDFKNPLGPYEMSADFEFKQVTVDAALYEQIMYEHMRIEPEWWSKQEYLKQHPIFKVSEASIDFFHTYFHMLALQLNDRPSDYRNQIMMLIVKSAVMELLNLMDKMAVLTGIPVQRHSVNHGDYVFREFIRLLQKNPHQREVQWYAKQMNITPKYLSEVCKERSKKPAGEWIADVTVAELKHYLQNTTMPIREIAMVMEFPNPSFFCQYTKKHLGETPNHYRKKRKPI